MIKPLPRMCIVIDTREQKPWEFSAGVDTVVRKLDFGDYSVAGYESRWAIERKSLQDFVNSICAGRERFLRELSVLRRYEYAAIVVEADLADVVYRKYRGDSHPNSVLGTTWALCTRYVPVLWAGNAAAAMCEGLLWRLLRDDQAMAASGPQMAQEASNAK